jgi:hypothetical protein
LLLSGRVNVDFASVGRNDVLGDHQPLHSHDIQSTSRTLTKMGSRQI